LELIGTYDILTSFLWGIFIGLGLILATEIHGVLFEEKTVVVFLIDV
jgi:hypothetical protein